MIYTETHSPDETERLGERIGKALEGKETVALFGGLGMGKTALTRGIAKGLGSPDDVTSPTFALVNEYRGRCNIYHFDMYRVSTWDDLYSTGFFDYLDNGVLIIEWSENIENALPQDAVRITVSRLGDNDRSFEIEGDIKLEDFSA